MNRFGAKAVPPALVIDRWPSTDMDERGSAARGIDAGRIVCVRLARWRGEQLERMVPNRTVSSVYVLNWLLMPEDQSCSRRYRGSFRSFRYLS